MSTMWTCHHLNIGYVVVGKQKFITTNFCKIVEMDKTSSNRVRMRKTGKYLHELLKMEKYSSKV